MGESGLVGQHEGLADTERTYHVHGDCGRGACIVLPPSDDGHQIVVVSIDRGGDDDDTLLKERRSIRQDKADDMLPIYNKNNQ